MAQPLVPLLALLIGFALCPVVGAVTPAQLCQSAKNKSAGKYDYCRQKAESSLAKSGDTVKYAAALAKCTVGFDSKWAAYEAKAASQGGACPSVGDQVVVRTFVDTHTTALAVALGGGAYPTCAADLATCQADLATCQSEAGGVIKTGLTTCYDETGAAIACAGTGQDGEQQRGVARSYTDNGDGTITDNRTQLVWEKLSRDGSIHDRNTTYSWANAFAKVAALNTAVFGGHNDWRLPNVNELQTLSNYGQTNPAVGVEFNTACTIGCTVLTCSCSGSNDYWTSTPIVALPGFVYSIYAGAGFINATPAAGSNILVRAVRGGA